ncbi:MAG: ZIP family metal transporter [Candidatus Altiarchaeota archaeon]
MSTFYFILIATLFNSLIALIGIFSIWISDKALKKILIALVALSAGGLLSGAFFHLMTEAMETFRAELAFLYLTFGFISFFIMEKILFWHHCHESGKCKTHPFTYLILIGDGIHNFIDGLVIAASFLIDINFGITTTFIIITHEIPQELGDFGALIHGGFSKIKALIFNLISQMTCIVGGIIGFLLSGEIQFINALLPFAAGGFIYISASDLIPELHKEVDLKKSLISFVFFLLGFLLIFAIKLLEH